MDEAIKTVARYNYARLSEILKKELTFLGEIADQTFDSAVLDTIIEVQHSLNEAIDTLDIQRISLYRSSQP